MQLYHLEGYNKLNTTLMWFDKSNNLVLTVETHKRNKDIDRFFYSEYSSKNGVNSYLDFYCYLEIGSIYASDGIKNRFRIDNSNMYQFIMAIQTITNWLTSKSGADLFAKTKDGVIKVNPAFTPVKITGPFNGHLEFSPSARYNELGTESKNGINIFINDASDPIFMNVSQFLNFAYFINKFNLYESGMALINFLGRPEKQHSIDMPSSHASQQKGFFDRTGAKRREDSDV